MHVIKLCLWASWVGWFCSLWSSHLSIFPSLHLNLVSLLLRTSSWVLCQCKTMFSPVQKSAPLSRHPLISQDSSSSQLPCKEELVKHLDLATYRSNPARLRSPTSPISSQSFSFLSWSSSSLEFYLYRFRKWHHFIDTVRLQLKEGYFFPNYIFSKLSKGWSTLAIFYLSLNV